MTFLLPFFVFLPPHSLIPPFGPLHLVTSARLLDCYVLDAFPFRSRLPPPQPLVSYGYVRLRCSDATGPALSPFPPVLPFHIGLIASSSAPSHRLDCFFLCSVGCMFWIRPIAFRLTLSHCLPLSPLIECVFWTQLSHLLLFGPISSVAMS